MDSAGFRQTVTHTKRQPFGEHLKELRNRLMWYLVSVVVGTVIAYVFHERIITLLTKPINQAIFYSSPGGGFDFLIKICLFSGVLFSLPVLVYQSIRFLEPVLPHRSKVFLVLSLLASALLLMLGVVFAYSISLPAAIHFLNGFSTQEVRSLIMTNEYLSFMMVYLVGFGIIFQLPLFLLIVNHFQPFERGALRRKQKWVIAGSMIVAAIITPTTDIFNLLILALPIIILYQFSALVIWWLNRTRRNPPLQNI